MRFIHRSMVKKRHVTLVMYELLKRVSMDSFPPSVIQGKSPWGEINIKSMHLVSIVGFV